MLLSGPQGAPATPQETEATAELDTPGLLQLQRNMMQQQDDALETMSKTVKSVKVSMQSPYAAL